MPLARRRPTDRRAGGMYKGERRKIYIIRPVVVVYERVSLVHPDRGNHGNPRRAGDATARDDVTAVAILIHTLNGRARIITRTFFLCSLAFSGYDKSAIFL